MKSSLDLSFRPRLFRATLALLTAATSILHASNIWDGGGGSPFNWSDNNNWGGSAPTYGTLTFAGATGTTNVMDASMSQNQIQWNGSSNWTLNNSGGAVLSLFDNGGTQAKIENYSTGGVTINAPITFAATAGNAWGEINAVNGSLTFASGTLTVSGAGVNGIRMFGAGQTTNFNSTVAATGKYFATSAVGTTVNIGGAFTSGDFYLMNNGVLNLNTGGTFTTTGLRLGGDSGNTGTQDLTKGATFNLTNATGGQTFAGIINPVAGNTSGALLVNSQNTSGTNTLSGSIFLDAPLTVQVGTGGTLASTGVISNGALLTKMGGGILNLTNANTYSGGTTISGGTLKVTNTGAAVTVTGTGVTTPAVNNPLGTGTIALSGGTLELNPLATVNQNGLSGRLFNLGGVLPLNNDNSNVNFTAAATDTRYDANLNRYDLTTASGGGTALATTTQVAVQWTGKLKVTAPGSYRFFVAADDGIRVFVDGVLAVNNDGSKGTTDLGGAAISLSAGLHDVRVDYTQGGGGGAAILSWAGATTGLDAALIASPIPTTTLFTAESNSTAGSSNAVIVGAGTGDAVNVTANSTINLNGTAFTQAQLGGLTNTTGNTLTVNGLAGKTLRLAGNSTITGTLTLSSTPDVAFDGILAGTGATLVKQGPGRVIFSQTTSANTLDAASLLDIQGGTAVLVGGTNNPLGAAGIRLNGGNVVLDSKGGPQTFANAITVAQNGTIQSIVAGALATTQPIQTLSGTIAINSGATLTFDPINGGNNTNNNPTGNTADIGAQITASGVISGAGNLAATSTSLGNIVFPGTVLLSNAGNSFSGSVTLNGTTFVGNTSVPVNGPTLRIGAAGALPSTATTVINVKSGILDFATNNVAYAQNAANVITLGGGPATTTSNINIGTGVFTLNNDLVYDATNNGGVATIKGNGAASGILDLNTAGQRTINVGDSSNAAIDMVINSVIAGTGGGGLTKTGAGTLAIQANVAGQANTYTGLTRVQQGTLFLGGGGVAFAGAASGAILGNVQVDSGATLLYGGANNLPDASPVLTINGTWNLNGFGETTGNLNGSGTITSSLPANLRFDFSAANDFSYTGAFTGQVTFGMSGRTATAPITVPTSQFSALTYNGNTIIGDQNAVATTGNVMTLVLSSNNALPFGYNKGDLVIGSGASGLNKGILDLAGFNQTVNGLTGVGALSPTITNNSATQDSTLTIGAGATFANSNTFNGIIQNGTGGFTVNVIKTGLGTEIFSGPSTYTGLTTINAGKLSVGNAASLGNTATGTVVNSGGILDIVNVSIAEPLTLNGRGQPLFVTVGPNGGPLYTGSLQASGGIAGVVTSTITLGTDAVIGVPVGSALTLSGAINGAFGLTKTQGSNATGGAPATIGAGGTLVLAGSNNYTGPTTIEAGELRINTPILSTVLNLGANGAQGVPNAGLVTASTSGTTLTLGASNVLPSNVVINLNGKGLNNKFQLNGFNQTIKGFTGDAGISTIIQNFETGGAGASILTVDTAGTDTAFNGRIRDQSGTIGITKAGAGTFTLSGINSQSGNNIILYTGQTTINGGKLVLQDTTGFNSAIANNVAGSAGLEFALNYARVLTYTKAITGTAGFTKSGPGTLILNGTAPQFAGTDPIQVTGGALVVQGLTGVNTLIGNAVINVAAGAQLDLWGAGAFASPTTYNPSVTLNGLTPGGALVVGGINGQSSTILSGQLTLAGAGLFSNVVTGWADHLGTITGKITGAGGLQIEKQNYSQQPPVIVINNSANDYSGGTTINGGTVYFSTAASLPSTGNLTLGGYQAASSQTTLNGPNIALGAGGLSGFTRALGTGAGQINITGEGGGFSAVGSAQTVNFGGGGSVDWGAAGLSANAALWFNGSNSSTVTAGPFNADNVVTVANDLVLSTGGMRRVYVVNNNVTNADWAAFSGAISGPGGLIKDGGNSAAAANVGGFLVFNGATSNTYTGVTDVIGGALGLEKTGGATAIAGDISISNLQGGSRRIVYLGASDQIADTATVNLLGQSGQNGDFRLFGFNETVAAITDRSGGGVIEVGEATDPGYKGVAISTTAASTLTVSGSQDSFYNGFMRNNNTAVNNLTSTGAFSLTKSGAGTLTLSAGQQSGNGSIGYSGNTIINGGSLVFSNLSAYNSPIAVNGVTSNVGFNTNLNQSLTNGQVISGTGNVFKNGAGTMILSVANAYSGTTTVNNGFLTITGTTTAGQTGNYIVNSPGVLTIGNGTTGGILTANNNITVNAGGVVAFSHNVASTYSGIISGAGNVENRAGTVGNTSILSGANTYSGTTTVMPNTTLVLGGSGASAGGATVHMGGNLTLDFNLAGSNAGGILAATTPVNLNGGTLALSGSAAANTQTLGNLMLGTVQAGGYTGFTPTLPGNSASNLNLTSGAGGLNVTLGTISHATGGTLNVILPVFGTVSTTGAAVGSIANGFTTTNTGTTWLAQSGGVLTPLTTYGADTYGAGIDTDVVAGGAGGSTNSLRFNTAANTTVTLSVPTVIDSGGILVTSNVANFTSTISGSTLAGSSTAGLTLIQNNTANTLNISSAIIDNGGATGLTKAGAGVVTLSGANSYTGQTYVAAGTLVLSGTATTGAALVSVAPTGTLQIGDNTTNGVLPTNLINNGTVVIGNGTAQTINTPFNASNSVNFLNNATSNPTSFNTGIYTKTGLGTLTLTNTILTTQFHQRAGTTVLDSGANVIATSYNSVGQLTGDVAVLTVKGIGKITDQADFNVGDVTGTVGTLNIQGQGVVNVGNLYVGKSGTAVGVVNQTFGTLTRSGGSQDWRIGGAGVADTAAYGAYNLSAGNFTTTVNFQIGSYGIGVWNQTGGVALAAGGFPDVGRFSTGNGLMSVSNGTFTNNQTSSSLIIGEDGKGVFTLSGNGIVNGVTTSGGGVTGLRLGHNATGTGIANLNGGFLNTTGVTRGAGVGILNFNGGTLRANTGALTAFLTGLTNANVYAGGATVDTGGLSVTMAQALLAPAGNGVLTIPVTSGGSGYLSEPVVNITGVGTGATAKAVVTGGVVTAIQITGAGINYASAPSVTLVGGGATTAAVPGTATVGANAATGGFTKTNVGALTVSGTSTYGGNTTINGGSIIEAFSTTTGVGSTNLLPNTGLVLSGGSLTLTGFAAGTNTQSFVTNGTFISGVGTVVSNIGTGGTMVTSLGAFKNAGGTAITATNVTGAAIDFSGTGVINTTTANTGTGTILGGWATFGGGVNWATGGGNITAMSTYAANTATTWTAAANTDQTIATTGLVGGSTTNSVRFNTATPLTVVQAAGTTSTIVSGGILITPTATTTANLFSGGTINSGGTTTDLVIHDYGTAATAFNMVSVIGAGTGGLVKAGPGLIVLSNPTANLYTGATTIGAGTLRVGVTGNFAIPDTSVVTIGAGATLDLNNFSETIGGLAGYGTVTTAVAGTPTLTVSQAGNTTFSGVILNGTGTGTILTKTGAGTLTLNGFGTNTYTGVTNINGGAIKLVTPGILSNNTQVNVNVASGLQFETTVPVISGLGGNSNFALTTVTGTLPVQLTVGNNNAGATYTGALTGSGTLIKTGSGFQFLTGNNTNSGGVVVNGGTLILSGDNSAASGGIVANSGGTAQITNLLSVYGATGRNIIVAPGGTVTAGSFSSNTVSAGYGTWPTDAFTTLLSRVDQGSTGVLGLQADATLQAPISENLDFSAPGSNLSLGSILTGQLGNGNTPVQYTGVITPNLNVFRLGGGSGRLILPNAATLAGANSLVLFGAGNTGGQVFLTGNYGFTGATTVNGGTTYVHNLTNGGVAGNLGAASNAASNLVLNGGTLAYVGTGSSTDRGFTLAAAPTTLDSSGSGPVNFTNTAAIGFLNSGNRQLTLQGNNTSTNTIAGALSDSVLVTGASGALNSGITNVVKNGNGTWVLSGANTFSGGSVVNAGVLQFNNAAAFGADMTTGPANVLANSGGAVALGGSLTSGIQTTLNRVSPLSAGTVALTANTAEAINFDGGSAGAGLPLAYLGAYGNVTYTGTLTPYATQYRLGGGGGVLSLPNGGLTGPRVVQIGGGGPGAPTGLSNGVYLYSQNQNLNGAVVLGSSSDYTGGTVLLAGGIVSATNVAALGTGPLKFQGGTYRAIDTTDISLASDGTARDIRIGLDTSLNAGTAHIEVVNGVNLNLSKAFGNQPTFGTNTGLATMNLVKYGAGTLTLSGGLNLAFTNGGNQTNNGNVIIERGTLSLVTNPTVWAGTLQIGSNNGGVGTLKLGANNVFGTNTVATAGPLFEIYSGSKIDLNGFSDSIRRVLGMGGIVNTGASSANLTVYTNLENSVIGGPLVGNFTLTVGGNATQTVGGSGNSTGLDLWNAYNSGFTGKLVANSGGLRIRADGTLGATTEAFAADKITLNNGAFLQSITTFIPITIGANHGITLGASGGTLASPNNSALIVNSPIAGSGMLTIGDETGTVYLGSDTNSYSGGTTISSVNTRGSIALGTGGANGNLPAGDVLFNTTGGRFYVFKSSNTTIPNNFNGNGQILQIGSGTTTLTGNNFTQATNMVGGGKLRADFSGGNTPISTGTGLQVSAGTFEYLAPAGTNTLRLGTLTATAVTTPGSTGIWSGGFIGDSTIQSTYGGSGTQSLIFGGNARGTAGVTTNFVTNGGSNGVTNSILFSAGPAVNNIIGAAYFYNGADFAALDINGFVRAANFGADANTAPLNTLLTGKYSKLTTSLINQGPVQPAGIELVGANVNLMFASSGNTASPFTPGAILKSGGGGLAGVSVINGGTMALTINPQVTTAASLSTNGTELILRTDTVNDFLQIDMPIAGGGVVTKSGSGTLILSAVNTYTGSTLINSGTVQVTGNGILGGNPAAGSSIRIANAAGSTAVVNLDSATASIAAGLSTSGDRLTIGEAGNGTLNQTAGTVNANQSVILGDNMGSLGTYNISAGTLNVKNNNSNGPLLTVGRAGTGVLNISGTAAVNVKLGAQIQLGAGQINAGNFLATTAGSGLVPNVGINTGVGTINQTGGTVVVDTNNGAFQSNSYGGVIIGVDGTGTYNLNGGSLTTPFLARGNGTATFNLGGGTLISPATVVTVSQPLLNLSLPVNLTGTGGSGTINTNGNDMASVGGFTGVGGLIKTGGGTLTTQGASTNTGGITLGTGSIVASDTSLGSGNVNLGAGTTLQLAGVQQGLQAKFTMGLMTSVTPGVTNGNTAMEPELASLDALNTFLAGKPVIALEATTARGKTTLDYLESGGSNGNTALPPALVALTSGNPGYTADLRGKFNATTAGDYTFQTRADDAAIVWIDGAPVLDNNRQQAQTTRTGTISLSAGSHDVVIAYYNNSGGNGFSIGVTLPGQGQSYLNGSELNASNSLFSFGSNALNVGSLSGSGTVQLSSVRTDGTVNVGGLTFGSDNSNAAFSGNIQGAGSITKVGTGVQTLSGSNNTYTLSTNITNGTLLLGASNVLPDTAALNLSTGATLATGGYSDSTGLLSINGASSIDTGSGTGTITFAGVTAWTDMLSVWNYTGAIWTPGTDKLLFTSIANIDLNKVTFFSGNIGDTGSQIGMGGGIVNGNELVPVPEASGIAAALALLGLAVGRERRRFFHYRK